MVSSKQQISINNKNRIKWLIFAILSSLILLGIESISYFWLAIVFGNLWYPGGPDQVLNLQTPLDKAMPWLSWLFPFYILWAFGWFIIIPIFIFFINGGFKKNGKQEYLKYFLNSFLMYIISTLIYMLIPTTCRPIQFANSLSPSDPFYNEIHGMLLGNDLNVFGSCPSYHNYWASLFVFFGAKIFSNKEKRQTMSTLQAVLSISSIIVGLFISLSTLTLHQHNIPDVIITYSMTLTIALIINHFNFTSKLENLFDKIKWNIK